MFVVSAGLCGSPGGARQEIPVGSGPACKTRKKHPRVPLIFVSTKHEFKRRVSLV